MQSFRSMFTNTHISVFFACMIELSTGQGELFGSLGQSGEMGMFEEHRQSGENGQVLGFQPFIGFGPFGAFGGYGFSRQNVAGGQRNSEAAAESAAEPATESTETSGYRQPSLMDIYTMLVWNQLLGNQGYMSRTDGAQVSGASGQQVKPQPEVSVSGTPGQHVKPQPEVSVSAENSYSADMSWIPYFMLQH